MRLLVTGGAGFIGTNFIYYWLQNHPDDTIVNLDALTYAGRRENLKPLEGTSQYIFIEGNITDPAVVAKAMEGADAVVHFAAESHVDRSITGPAVFVETNVVGTHVLLEAARAAKVKRFHHISTDEVFGSLPLHDPDIKFNESTPYDPRSPYSASKAASDHLVRSYYHTFGLPVTISNCSNNYGPYQFPEKLIPLMIGRALNDQSLPVYGKGENVRDWIHVEDHCRGISLILEKGDPGETYCIGGHAEKNNLEVVHEILRKLDKPDSLISYVEDRLGHDLRYAIDDDKIRRELGYEPQHTFETGLHETIQWYVERREEMYG